MKKNLKLPILILLIFFQSLLSGCNVSGSNNNNVLTNKPKGTVPEKVYYDEKSTDYIAGDLTQPRNDIPLSDNNPIDKAFEKDFNIATATPELNYLSDEYYNAWKNEWNNVISQIKEQYKYAKDKTAIDTYKKYFEKFVDQAGEVEWMKWSDTSEPPGENRSFGTGAASGSQMEQAQFYKRQVLHLIDSYFGPEYAEHYRFIYKGNGAELEKKIRESK